MSPINDTTQHVVFNATITNGASKMVEDGAGGVKWVVGDVIIVKQGDNKLGELTCKNENGIFEGDITTPTGNIKFTFGTQSFLNQTGALNDAIFLSTGDVAYKEDGNYNDTMYMPHAVLKLNLSELGTANGNVVTINDGTSDVVTVAGVKNTSTVVYVAVPADGTEKTYTISGNDYGCDKTWTLNASTFYTGSTTGDAIVITAQQGHGYVDLGLSVKWATCNVGAESPEGYGDYFAWGEILPYYADGYSQESPCEHWRSMTTGAGSTVISGYDWFTYYNTTAWNFVEWPTPPYTDGVLNPERDAARANWGGSWRMPTREELEELSNSCSVDWITMNGVDGMKLTSYKNGKTLFLPAAGYRDGTSLECGTPYSYPGFYWSSTLDTEFTEWAYFLVSNVDLCIVDSRSRCYGLTVRPVR